MKKIKHKKAHKASKKSYSRAGDTQMMLIVIGVALVLIGLVGGIYFGMHMNKNASMNSAGQNETNSSSLEQTNPASNWQIYTNSTYKFQMQYPQDWEKSSTGNDQQEQITFKGSEGTITIITGGGFGGGPCPSEKIVITTKIGDISYCKNESSDGTVHLSMDNLGVAPKDLPQYINIQGTVNTPISTNEELIKSIIATFDSLNK